MKFFNPPHEVRDNEKFANMVKAIEQGQDLPPIVVLGDEALTGSHRLAAWKYCEEEPETIEIEDEDYCKAMEYLGLDPMFDSPTDHNNLCQALYETTQDADIKDALVDQF